ncbi:hypothetical protein H4R33_006786 [Dimargaris cristalligena]|nr:hypothetical protein H4R33_006786 [Dimargaris cristalligena]
MPRSAQRSNPEAMHPQPSFTVPAQSLSTPSVPPMATSTMAVPIDELAMPPHLPPPPPKPVEIDHQLITDFFEFVYPQAPMFHQPTFFLEIARGLIPQYLLNAMYAIASRFSRRPSTILLMKFATSEKYANQVREYLKDYKGPPVIKILQTTMIMSVFEFGVGNVPEGARLGEVAMNMYKTLNKHDSAPITAGDLAGADFSGQWARWTEAEILKRAIVSILVIQISVCRYIRTPLIADLADIPTVFACEDWIWYQDAASLRQLFTMANPNQRLCKTMPPECRRNISWLSSLSALPDRKEYFNNPGRNGAGDGGSYMSWRDEPTLNAACVAAAQQTWLRSPATGAMTPCVGSSTGGHPRLTWEDPWSPSTMFGQMTMCSPLGTGLIIGASPSPIPFLPPLPTGMPVVTEAMTMTQSPSGWSAPPMLPPSSTVGHFGFPLQAIQLELFSYLLEMMVLFNNITAFRYELRQAFFTEAGAILQLYYHLMDLLDEWKTRIQQDIIEQLIIKVPPVWAPDMVLLDPDGKMRWYLPHLNKRDEASLFSFGILYMINVLELAFDVALALGQIAQPENGGLLLPLCRSEPALGSSTSIKSTTPSSTVPAKATPAEPLPIPSSEPPLIVAIRSIWWTSVEALNDITRLLLDNTDVQLESSWGYIPHFMLSLAHFARILADRRIPTTLLVDTRATSIIAEYLDQLDRYWMLPERDLYTDSLALPDPWTPNDPPSTTDRLSSSPT